MTSQPPSTGPVTIRRAAVRDAEAMLGIYNHEVENFITTTDMVPRTLDQQRTWIEERSGAFAAIVAVLADGEDGEQVVGFASLSKFKERAAYSPTVENSVYVSRAHSGAGIGRLLMDRLIEDARDGGFHSIIARVEASSAASRALHRACGFELVGVEREVGRKLGRWLDIAILQLMLRP